MSVASTTNRVSYTGNGSVSTYSYTFRIFDDDDLRVTVKDTDDVETTLTKTTDYTVTGVGLGAGGSISLVNSGQAWLTAGNLTTGFVLVIRRVLPLTQNTDIRNQGDFFPEAHEDQFDRSAMIAQQQQDELDRSVKLAETIDPSSFDPTIPPAVVGANNLSLVINGAGNGFTLGPTTTEISNAQGYAQDAQEWASKTDGIVDSTDYSSKAWAIGGTGVTDTASRGAAKEWAVETSGTVDGTEYSAKEYAQGVQAGTGGSAKDWAIKTSADVSGSEYSSKEYAVGTQRRGLANGGSAKDWASYTGGTVDNVEYSAKYHAQQAALSASAAQWDDVRFITFADSPVTVADGEAGVLFNVDCTGGNIVFNLPTIAGLTLTNPWSTGFKKVDSTTNSITVNCSGSDTFDGGATSLTLTDPQQGVIVVPDADSAPDQWTRVNFGDLKNLYGATIQDYLDFNDRASSPSNPSAGFYRVYIKTDGRAYILDSLGVETPLGSGGGGSSLIWEPSVDGFAAPVRTVLGNIPVWQYDNGLSQQIFAVINVPNSYVAGKQINLRVKVISNDTSGNVLLRAQSTLIRTEVDEYDSTINQRTTTNSAITMSTANDKEPQRVTLDITSSTGQVNGVSVSANDMIIVRLYRDTDTATGALYFVVGSEEITTT